MSITDEMTMLAAQSWGTQFIKAAEAEGFDVDLTLNLRNGMLTYRCWLGSANVRGTVLPTFFSPTGGMASGVALVLADTIHRLQGVPFLEARERVGL